MNEIVVFSNDRLNVRIQQKINVKFLLKWFNLILYPSKHGDRYQT